MSNFFYTQFRKLMNFIQTKIKLTRKNAIDCNSNYLHQIKFRIPKVWTLKRYSGPPRMSAVTLRPSLRVETGHFHIEEALHAQLKLGFWEGLKSSEFNTAGLRAVTQHPRNRGNHESPHPPFLDSGLWILNRLVHSTQSKCGPPFSVCLCFLLDNSMFGLFVFYRNQQSGDCDSDTSSVLYSRIHSHSDL